MTFTDEQVEKAYAAAPEHTREFLVEGDFVSLMSSFATREGFSGEKRSELITVIRNFAIGLETEDSVRESLVAFGINAPRVTMLLQTITQSIVPSDKRAPRFSVPLSQVSKPVSPLPPETSVSTATEVIPTVAPGTNVPKNEVVSFTRAPVQTPKTTAPTSYTADPYREPVE